MSFPTSPVNGQTTSTNGIVYTYNSTNSSWKRTPGTTAVGLGVNQTWQNFDGIRLNNTTYTNSTGKPIMINATFQVTNSAATASATINGTSFTCSGYCTTQGGQTCGNVSLVVPTGATYSLSAGGNGITHWSELR